MRTAVLACVMFLAATLIAAGSQASSRAGRPAPEMTPADQPVALLHNPHDADRLDNGHTLITDGGYPLSGADSRVLEVDEEGNIVWSFADGLNFAHSAQRLPNDHTLIADTGNDRVIEVSLAGAVVWNSDDHLPLSDNSTLNYPNDADWLSTDNHLLITDRDNHRVLEISRLGGVLWQFGETGVPLTDTSHLNGPHNADRLDNGNTIIADSNNNRILEVTPSYTITWEYHPLAPDNLHWPRDADRLDNGNTLIADSDRARLIEVASDYTVTWQYAGLEQPYDGDRLPDGHTLISRFSRGRVIEVDEAGAIVWSYPPGLIDVELPSASTGSPTGTLAVRIEAPVPGGARYHDGAPVVVWLPGGYDSRDLRHGLPAEADDLIILTFLFPEATDVDTGRHSTGTYDYRGEDCIRALSDVIRYAAGELTDSQGRTIDEVVPVAVLHDNIGLIGASNGGNIIVAAPALEGTGLAGHLRYLVQWETPVSSQVATRDLGRVWMKPCPAQGDFFNWRYQGYDPLRFPVDYSDLAYNPTEPYYPVFHDGGGGPNDEPNGEYDTDPAEPLPPSPCVSPPPSPDINDDGDVGPEDHEDFPVDTYPGISKLYYSRAATYALAQYDVFAGNWPVTIAITTEADAYWDIRESVRLYDQALVNVPDLEGMVLASVRDHVQSAPDKPHIRQALEGWDEAGAWVQINPSPAYVLAVDPSLDPSALPDNDPNTPPLDWGAVHSYCYPERNGQVPIGDGVFQLAAIWQMADRAHATWIYLPLIVR